MACWSRVVGLVESDDVGSFSFSALGDPTGSLESPRLVFFSSGAPRPSALTSPSSSPSLPLLAESSSLDRSWWSRWAASLMRCFKVDWTRSDSSGAGGGQRVEGFYKGEKRHAVSVLLSSLLIQLEKTYVDETVRWHDVLSNQTPAAVSSQTQQSSTQGEDSPLQSWSSCSESSASNQTTD